MVDAENTSGAPMGGGMDGGYGTDGTESRQLNVLRDKLRNLDRQLAALTHNNARLVAMLETARAEIVRLKDAEPEEKSGKLRFFRKTAATAEGLRSRYRRACA